jgi:hypothetical protein
MDQIKPENLELILLTGCIDTMGMHFTSLQNMEVRKAQYVEAINFYLQHTSSHILFVENSGNDISAYFRDNPNRERLEFLTFQGNNFNKALGKGYGEMVILEHALKHSLFIKRCASICKITGRYKILNIKPLLEFYAQEQPELMVLLAQRLNYSDSRLFFATPSFYKEVLLKYKERVDDSKGEYFEHALCKAVLEAINSGYSYLPFKYKLRISGQSGTDSIFYKDSWLSWYPWNLLHILKFKLNKFWQ